jgi:hypothetical protein
VAIFAGVQFGLASLDVDIPQTKFDFPVGSHGASGMHRFDYNNLFCITMSQYTNDQPKPSLEINHKYNKLKA